MSDFFAVISNVKIIKPMAGASVTIERSILSEKLSDTFPPADVIIRNGIVHVFADIPGMSCKDVSVYVCDNFVVLEGSKSCQNAYEGYELVRLERRFPSFKRVFKLPFNPCRYEAFLDNGVLHIILAR
ncbi:MAG: Hsp20/alpha crystallin family protein [Deferribacterales bacterium]|nr:Hsp20/alpha crystallin family protein [Deferribacterales bacterium]